MAQSATLAEDNNRTASRSYADNTVCVITHAVSKLGYIEYTFAHNLELLTLFELHHTILTGDTAFFSNVSERALELTTKILGYTGGFKRGFYSTAYAILMASRKGYPVDSIIEEVKARIGVLGSYKRSEKLDIELSGEERLACIAAKELLKSRLDPFITKNSLMRNLMALNYCDIAHKEELLNGTRRLLQRLVENSPSTITAVTDYLWHLSNKESVSIAEIEFFTSVLVLAILQDYRRLLETKSFTAEFSRICKVANEYLCKCAANGYVITEDPIWARR